MYEVKYFADPDKITNDHISNWYDCMEYSVKEFPTMEKAALFLDKCVRPITTMAELYQMETAIVQDFKRNLKLMEMDCIN